MAGRRKVVIGVVLVAVLLVGGVAAMRSRQNGTSKAQASYVTTLAKQSPLSVTVSGTGSVTLANRQEIRAEVTGIVREILVSSGQTVKSGDVLMRLKNDDLVAQAQQARISYDLALNQLADMVGTSPEKAMSVDVSNGLSVSSKWAGRLTSLKVVQGDHVSAGAVIGTVAQDSRMFFVTALTEGYASRLRTGDPVSIRIEGFDGELEGRVSSVSKSTRATGTSIWLDVVVEIANPGLLRAGSKGTATFRSADGDTFLGDGTVELSASGSIKAPVSGTVSKILAREGSMIKAGETILVISDPSLSLDISSKKLSVEQSMLSRQKAQRNVDSLTIRAPANGVVVSIPVELGNNIEESPVLAIIADTNHAEAVVEVDELDLAKIKTGMPAKVTVDALGSKVFTGHVKSIAAEGTQQSGVAKFDVTVTIDSPEGLRTGMTANVEIMVAEKANALVVPAEAVTGTRGQETVKVLDANGQVSVRKVSVGLFTSRLVEITAGLTEGERVVVAASSSAGNTQQQMRMFMGPGVPGGGPRPGEQRNQGGSSGGARQ
ncbi:MAG: efflux RND transporter periplasmic adaptor subunit [Firmicutes bacterium]|nr:efflux RND transporter periplasmic adaptor subunit [Bacillota bacterium]